MIAAVHITKKYTWRGQPEEFENVYHYSTPVIDSDAGWSALVDAIVAAEKPLFDVGVTFTKARVNGPTDGTKAENVMQYVKDLSGNGTASSAGAPYPPEMTIVGEIYVGRSPKGYKVFLRKYYHTMRLAGSATGSAQTFGNGVLTAADKAPVISALNSLKQITIGAGVNDLCTPSGRELPSGATPTVLDYLHVRQFRR